MSSRVLIVDDEPVIGSSLTSLLTSAGYTASWVANAADAVTHVESQPTDLALVDLKLGADSGLVLLEKLRDMRPEMSVIVVTALATIETAVAAMRAGADNFLTKPVDPARLLALVAKGVEAEALRRKGLQLDRLGTGKVPTVVAESAGMRNAVRLADTVAARDATVLLLGETGSGKGILARYIHEKSPRAGKPFVELNCAGLSKELTESELFGHEKGAFTSATQRKLGLFDAAHGGTLFLDEIGEMDPNVQSKLLKVLESQRFRRVGGLSEVTVDVRVIAATHRDLAKDVTTGRFRSDLYYRLNVFAIMLPPLRERRDEIAALARSFTAHVISEAVIDILQGYAWPGNVRELRNIMERASILCPHGEPIEPEHLPPLEPMHAEADGAPTFRDAERRFLEGALQAHGGNILRTAQALGVSRGLLYRKMEKYGLK